MFRLRRAEWKKLSADQRGGILKQTESVLAPMEKGSANGHPNQSAVFSLVGHKGDLLFLHFRETLEDLHRAERALSELDLWEYLEPTHSYLSVVELGLYESSAKTYGQLAERGVEPHTPEWQKGMAEVTQR